MTQLPTHPLTDRKDLETLISHQTQNPCLHGNGFGAESVLAFLLQLYAYVFSHSAQNTYELPELEAPEVGGTKYLKEYFMTSGPYWVVRHEINFRLRPNALKMCPMPDGYNGPGLGRWMVLWPGAMRDRYDQTGSGASRLCKLVLKARVLMREALQAVASAISVMGAMVTHSGHHCVPSTDQNPTGPYASSRHDQVHRKDSSLILTGVGLLLMSLNSDI